MIENVLRRLHWRLNHPRPSRLAAWTDEHPTAAMLAFAAFLVLGNIWCGGWD